MTDEAGDAGRGKSSGYGALLRGNADFRNLWLGQVVSLLGDWFNLVACATLVQTLTGSGAAVGFLFALRMLAPFAVSPLAGVVADRYDRRAVLIATDLLRAVVVLGFLFVREPGDVWMLYVLTALQLGLSGFFFPAHRAILPDLVERKDLGAANTIGSATWSMMLALGAAAGGFVAGRFGVYASFAIDGVTFLASAWFLMRIRHRAPVRAAASGGVRGAARQYIEGMSYLRRNVDVALVASHKAVNALLVAGGFQVVQVFIAEHVFVIGKDGSTGLGLIWSVVGVGTGLGPLVVRRFTRDDDALLRRSLALSYVVTATGLATVAFATSFPMVLVGSFLRGVGSGTGWVVSTQLLLHLVPDRVRGRVFSSEFALMTLASAAGSGAAGWALDFAGLGVEGLMLWMASLVILPAVLWALWTRRHPTGLAPGA